MAMPQSCGWPCDPGVALTGLVAVTESTAVSFADAMALTGTWLEQWESGELSEEVLADRVAELVASRDGARGFFVVALAGVSPLMDRLPEVLVLQLRLAGASVVDLSVRNLAMSTAMALAHGRAGDGAQQLGSERVQARSLALLQQLDPHLVKARLEPLLAAASSADPLDPAPRPAAVEEDLAFLQRWGYDAEQRQAIAAALEAVAD